MSVSVVILQLLDSDGGNVGDRSELPELVWRQKSQQTGQKQDKHWANTWAALLT